MIVNALRKLEIGCDKERGKINYTKSSDFGAIGGATSDEKAAH